MTESSPSRLELLRFARRVLVQQARANLAQLDGWIAAEEQRAQERRRAEERRPPPPKWLLERGTGAGESTATVHHADCWLAVEGVRTKGISEDQARRALYEHVSACSVCHPDTRLGVIPG